MKKLIENNMKYRLIKDLPFKKADDTEWEIVVNDNCHDGSWWLTDERGSRLVWAGIWGNPLTSGFFEPVEEKRWRAEEGEEYFSIFHDGEIAKIIEFFVRFDENRNKFGNYFRTKADAKLALGKYIKPAFEAAHEVLGY